MSFVILAYVLRLLLIDPTCLLVQSAMIDSYTSGQFPADNPNQAPQLQTQRIRVQRAEPQVLQIRVSAVCIESVKQSQLWIAMVSWVWKTWKAMVLGYPKVEKRHTKTRRGPTSEPFLRIFSSDFGNIGDRSKSAVTRQRLQLDWLFFNTYKYQKNAGTRFDPYPLHS